MTRTRNFLMAAAAIPLFAAPLFAQSNGATDSASAAKPAAAPAARTGCDPKLDPTCTAERAMIRQGESLPKVEIQHLRPADARGVNIFEAPKQTDLPYDGFKLAWGAAFTQQFQGLQHANTAAAKVVSGVDANKLLPIGHGFNNAVANLYLNAQLADGIRVQVETYASARHHQETWIKDGYALIDKSPIDNALLNKLMEYTTLRVGHFEVNYGDSHFRRSDNGQALYNPFVGNLALDAFTTEIGGEVYLRSGPFLAMGGLTGGEVHGQVTVPEKRSPSYLGKLGVDKQLASNLRVRLTGSGYVNNQSASNTLFTGDRGGSRYYDVLENTASTETANAWSGNVRPGFSNVVHSYVVNPFVKLGGLEYFGNVETATGKAAAEARKRTVRQLSNDVLYRFATDQLYVGARYNVVTGELGAGLGGDQNVKRTQVGGGWFVTPLLLTKVEYVKQTYGNFPVSDIRNGGQFKGFMVEGVLAF